MLRIILNNNECRLENVGLSLYKRILKDLTFRVPGAQFSMSYKTGRWKGTHEFFKRNIFSTGLLPIVFKIINEYEEPYKIIDQRKNPLFLNTISYNYKVGQKILRDYQVDAANSLISNKANELYFPRGIIHLATNAGKTVVSEAIISEILKITNTEKIILFVVPTVEVAFQSEKNFRNDFSEEIGFIGSGKWKTGRIIIALIPTLYKNIKSKRFNTISKNIAALIIDEVQHSSSSTYKKVIEKFDNAFIRIGLTGTIPKDDIKKHTIYSLIGPPTITINNDFLINHNASAKPECFFVEIREPKIHAYNYQDVYYEGIVNNIVRNTAIIKLIELERLLNHNILILVDRLEHGLIIKNMLKDKACGIIEFTNGTRKSKDRKLILEKLKNGEINILIATTVLDEGVDTDNINAIIYARGQVSPRKLLQGIGRGLRKKKDNSTLHFYDFLDFTAKDLIKHTLNRYETLKAEGFDIKEINLKKIEGILNEKNN